MKTTTLKSLLLNLALLIMVFNASAQDLTGIRIDVQGARFSDQMWLFSVPTCTYTFDNGWDGYKMFGTSDAPQIFAIEPDGYYQVSSVPDVNNTYIGFSAGVDTVYTLTFTNDNLAVSYQQLFLIDSVAKKTIDVYQTGSTYTFSALPTAKPVTRFKIVTSLPQVVINPPVPPVPPIVDPKNPKDKDKDDKNCPPKKLKIYCSGKNIFIENPGKQKGKMKLCHAQTGRVLKTVDFNAEGNYIIDPDLPKGVYVVNGATQSENISTLVIIH